MARQPATPRRDQRPSRTTASPATARGGLIAGAVCLAVSSVAALLLVIDHLGASLPGCGPGGACEQAANSIWGKLKIGTFDWPVSHLGLAYFAAALVTWLVTRAALPRPLRYIVRLGALASLGFCGIIVLEHLPCPYCLVAHLGNFAFWLTMELRRTTGAHPRGAFTAAVGSFIAATAVLGIVEHQYRAGVAARGERDLADATRTIIERSHTSTQSATPATTPVAPPRTGETARSPQTLPTTSAPVAPPPASTPADWQKTPFIGRYPHGPLEAPIRIVLFTDYQCADCRQIEAQLATLMKSRTDLCVSVKHFPFCKECNPSVERDMHPNACWAARAAEAAGMLWGADGFWKVHEWLFARRGSFTTREELEQGIRDLGFEPAAFVAMMTSQETLNRVRADAEEGKRLGLFFTPMIFINGVELKGWYVPNALARAITEIAATNPPPRTAAFDQPPLARDKYVQDWVDQPVRNLPPDAQAWTLGAEQPRIEIVLWGDYSEPYTAESDGIIRAFVAQHTDARYTYRHYPFNKDCNPQVSNTRFPFACRAAQAAEAGGHLGGHDAFWKLHAWLMEHPQQHTDEAVIAAATGFGLEAEAFKAAMDSPEVHAAVADDVQAGKQFPSLRHGTPAGLHSIPSIFINGRFVPRPRLGNESVLGLILDAAAAEQPAP